MAQYEIELLGTGIDVAVSSVTKKQVGYIHQYLKMKGYDDITQAHKELKYIGVDVNKSDVFNFYHLLFDEMVTVRILGFLFEEISRLNLKDMAAAKTVIPNFDERYNDSFRLDDYQKEDKNLLLKVNKHTTPFPYSAIFECDETPTIDDFAYGVDVLKTPNNNWEYVNHIFFKGQPLFITTLTSQFTGDVVLELLM